MFSNVEFMITYLSKGYIETKTIIIEIFLACNYIKWVQSRKDAIMFCI